MSPNELDAILNREVTIAFGQSATDGIVKNEKLTLRQLTLLKFREGPKTGLICCKDHQLSRSATAAPWMSSI